MILSSANLYAYRLDADTFDKVALAWYMASNKFDRNSMGRWTSAMTKLKAQILRSSIDNSMIFLPTEQTLEPSDDLVGNLILLCCQTQVFGVGIIVKGVCKCPDEYRTTDMTSLLAVHVLATSFTKEIKLDQLALVEQAETLPRHVYKLVEDIGDAVDIDEPDGWEYTYEQNVKFAHWFHKYVEDLEGIETPVLILEEERKRRVSALQLLVSKKQGVIFPPPRPFVISKMMKTHAKYASLFGRLK